MKVTQMKWWAGPVFAVLFLLTTTQAQTTQNAHTAPLQGVANALASLPDADVIIYASPQRIMNEAAPKVIVAADLAKLRADFADLKKSVGVDPSSIEYIAFAVRFQKPSADLSFVPPDLLVIASGDFIADSLLSFATLYLQDRARTEKHGSKTLTIMKIDPIADAAEKNPLLKSFTEMGAVALNTNTIAFGSVEYLKAAVDAADGNGRINASALNSLLRDPNALVSAAGSPLVAFAKSFGMLGTQAAPRENLCESNFGNFYAAITIDGSNFNLRGAMNTDNPDTAKIINGLMSGVIQQAIDSVPDKNTQTALKGIRMVPRENEIVIEAEVPQETIAALVREQMQPKKTATPAKPPVKPRRRVRRK